MFKFNEKQFESQHDFIQQGYRCGTPEPTSFEVTKIDETMRMFSANLYESALPTLITLKIQFTHINDGVAGMVSMQQRVDQIQVLNKCFKPANIHFFYNEKEVKTITKASWFRMGMSSVEEATAKQALQENPKQYINVYTGALNGPLGWATFPWRFRGNPINDGICLVYSTMPGGTTSPYNLGKTLVHEVGHFLGLYHTFHGGCNQYGDHVNDTESHTLPNYGHPQEGKHNACSKEVRAPIHNYMNYTDDACMNKFTSKQIDRMKHQIAIYRPELMRAYTI